MPHPKSRGAMSKVTYYRRAAVCYEQSEYLIDAARCHRVAGSPLRAAVLHEQAGRFDLAADDYHAAGDYETAGWLLVNQLEQPAAARSAVAEAQPGPRLELVLARCDLAEGRPADVIIPAIGRARADLADRQRVPFPHRDLENWAVAVGELARRLDQVALVFAAAVLGGRAGAADRWAEWALRVHGTRIVIA
jgi:hypothetical protein